MMRFGHPRANRVAVDGEIYHVINKANAQTKRNSQH